MKLRNVVWVSWLILNCAAGGWAMEGTVHRANGLPAAGAEVILRQAATPEVSAPCDSAGRFAMDSPTTEGATVAVRLDGAIKYVTSPLPLAFFNAGPLALVLSDGSGEKLPATPAATRSAHLASGPYTLSGTIYGGSSLLVNAQVALMDSSRTTVLDSTQTDASGIYSFSVADGTYDLRITPPSGSGLQVSYVNDVPITGANVVQNVVLVPQAVTVSGTIHTPDGTPVTYASLIVTDQNTGVGVLTINVYEPTYTFTVAPGTYKLDLYGWSSSGSRPEFTGSFLLRPILTDLVLTGDTTCDLVLPVVRMTGKVLDENGEGVAGVEFITYVSWTENHSERYVEYRKGDCTSETDGSFTFQFLPNSDFSLILRPPVSSPYPVMRFDHLSLTTDTHQNLVLPHGYTLEGTVRAPDGTPAKDIDVSIEDPLSVAGDPNCFLAHAVTDMEGKYAFRLAEKPYIINMASGNHVYTNEGQELVPNVLVPSNFYIRNLHPGFTLTTDTMLSLTLPFIYLSGKVVDEEGTPVPHVKLGFPGTYSYNDNSSFYSIENCSNDFESGADGSYTLPLFPLAGIDLVLNPPDDPRYASTVLTDIGVTTNTVRDLVLDTAYRLGGTVFGYGGQPVGGVNLVIYQSGSLMSNVTTGDDGTYHAYVSAGTYAIDLHPGGAVRPEIFPISLYVYPAADKITVSTDTTVNLDFGMRQLGGRTTDRNGVAVRNVQVTVPSPGTHNLPDGRTFYLFSYCTSDQAGRYLLAILDGIYKITITPPDQSGFGPLVIDNLSISGNVSQNIILNFVDTRPPRIVAGPYVNALTDRSALVEWATDEPATSVVDYGTSSTGEQSANVADLVTFHAVQLTSLTADTGYVFQVSSTDESGNGPAESGVLEFRTLPGPDVRAPQIVEGPVIQSIGSRSATVEWLTDEPATSMVCYGTDELDQLTTAPGLTLSHSVTLTGLSTDTLYYVQALSADAQGNGPTTSTILNFTTLPAADTLPPVILSGPLAIQITDTEATIAWTTDEPANSGVSYNDGTHYGVFTDPGLVTDHSVRLTGLTPSTQYSYTVSTTDASGNGPTLSATLTFATRAQGDSEPPVIVRGPVVHVLNHHLALITWWTDEPADSVVDFGTDGQLDQQVSRAQLTRHHVIPLTHLDSGTQYFFRAASTDALGNGPTTSTLQSFVTRGRPDTRVPVFQDGPRVIHRTNHSITLYWRTDEPSDSAVYYGEGERLNLLRADSKKETEHTIRLVNLEPGQIYSCICASTDASGNTAMAALEDAAQSRGSLVEAVPPGSFSTASVPDQTAPTITQGPQVLAVTDHEALIRWVTDEPADSRVSYGVDGQALGNQEADIDQVLEHTVILTNLSASTTYRYVVASVDSSGNGPASSAQLTFTTASGPDSVVPGLSGRPEPTTAFEDAQVTWTTAEPSDGYLLYGSSPDALDERINLNGYAQSQTVKLIGLQPGTQYYYVIVTTDLAGNQTRSEVFSLETDINAARNWALYE